MSMFCTMEKCKAKKGPCNCEKVMGAVLVLVAAAVAYWRLKA